MARSTFGGFGGDQVSLDPAGNSGFYKAAANYNATGTFWSASTGGSPYTDLVDPITSVALAGVSTDAHGHIVPFKGPDGITEGWLDFGGGRFKVTAIDSGLYATLPPSPAAYNLLGRDGSNNPTWTTSHASVARALGWYIVTDPAYGAVGDGSHDDTAAIQAAIDACLGGGTGSTPIAGRNAKGVVWLPQGTYKITASLKIYSTLGFHLMGAGDTSIISVSGTLTKALDIDGSYFGIYENFCVVGSTTSDTVTTVVDLEWTSTTSTRSSTGNRFSRITIRNLKFVVGFGFGLSNPSAQVDNVTIHHCMVTGQWTAGELTWWQSGFKVGNGSFANVLGYHFYGCGPYSARYGYHANAVGSFDVYGGSSGGAEADFNLTVSAAVNIQGVRSETSQRLMITGVSGAAVTVSLRDILFNSSSVPADNQYIQWGYGGELILDNVVCSTSTAAPVVQMTGNAGKVASVLINGGNTRTAAPSYIVSPSVNAPFMAVFKGYQQSSSGGPIQATWSELITTRGGVLKAPPGSTTQTTSYSISSSEDLTIFNGTSLTATLPDPTTVAAGLVLRVKNVNTSALTVNSAGTSKTIDGAASQSLAQWASGRYASDGTQWLSL